MECAMDASTYDAWYHTPRGGWIGEVEYRLLHRLLAPSSGASLLDVGCGTGYFTRRFARDGLAVSGMDPSAEMLAFAMTHAVADERYLFGDARALPFADRSFDLCVSVTALCFIREQSQALAEILRVTRRRFAIGLLNRASLLYLQKGQSGEQGAYRGAHWHTAAEVRRLFAPLPVTHFTLRTAIFLPSATKLARVCEWCLPAHLPWGAFLVVAGDVAR
jgi:ubiquinone/menaquinone biosynthesis C-methylase UbiE